MRGATSTSPPPRWRGKSAGDSVDKKQFADNLRREMKRRGVGAADLADRTGASASQIYNYLAGERMPRLDVALRLAAALSCQLDELCGYSAPVRINTKALANYLGLSEHSVHVLHARAFGARMFGDPLLESVERTLSGVSTPDTSRWTPAEISEIRADLARTGSPRRAAELHGCCVDTILQLVSAHGWEDLIAAGKPQKTNNPPRPKGSCRWTAAEVATLRKMYAEGRSAAEIAEALGRTNVAVANKKYELTKRGEL